MDRLGKGLPNLYLGTELPRGSVRAVARTGSGWVKMFRLSGDWKPAAPPFPTAFLLAVRSDQAFKEGLDEVAKAGFRAGAEQSVKAFVVSTQDAPIFSTELEILRPFRQLPINAVTAEVDSGAGNFTGCATNRELSRDLAL